MMKYEVKQMPDGTVEVLQSDGGEEILGRLVFRNVAAFQDCFDGYLLQAPGDVYIDDAHPGGKYLSAETPTIERGSMSDLEIRFHEIENRLNKLESCERIHEANQSAIVKYLTDLDCRIIKVVSRLGSADKAEPEKPKCNMCNDTHLLDVFDCSGSRKRYKGKETCPYYEKIEPMDGINTVIMSDLDLEGKRIDG